MRIQLAKKKAKREVKPDDSNTLKDELSHLMASDDHDDYIDGSGTLFEEAIQQLKTLQNNMIVVLVKHVASGFKMKSEPYKKERYNVVDAEFSYSSLCVHITELGATMPLKYVYMFLTSWHSLPPRKDLAITSLSSSLCDMVVYLRDVLEKMKQELADCLFTCFWKQLAEDLSTFLFDEVLSDVMYYSNESGDTSLIVVCRECDFHLSSAMKVEVL